MRRNRFLAALLLSLLAPLAWADRLYQIEVIVFRQAGEPLPASQPAPDDWAANSQSIDGFAQQPLVLQGEAAKLTPANGYEVLLHKSWSQNVGINPSRVALSNGESQLGHYPVEGTLTLQQSEVLNLDASFWANQFDADGLLTASEHLQQSTRLKEGTLTYLDHRSMGVLLRVSPL